MYHYRIIMLIFLGGFAAVGCRQHITFPGTDTALEFSADTVYVDTVFSGLGSSTRLVKIYNPSEENVLINTVALSRGENSFYRMNVNGKSGKTVTDVEIMSGDSAFVFIEISPDAAGATEMLYTDSILVQNGSVKQYIQLIATVWDAYYHFPDRILIIERPEPYPDVKIPYSILTCDEIWRNDKPHVVYGYAVVDSACSLNILAETQVHFHSGAGLWIYKGGMLFVDGANAGSITNPVVFQGDRLEPGYEWVPGQWGGILGGIFIMDNGPTSNLIQNAVIKNATTAIRLDSSNNATPQLLLKNSIITNQSRAGIYGGYGNLVAENVVVGASGMYSFYALGGNYRWDHCTFYNAWGYSSRGAASIGLFNYFEDHQGVAYGRAIESAQFNQCIIEGNQDNEIALGIHPAMSFNVQFWNSALAIEENPQSGHYSVSDTAMFKNCYLNYTQGFVGGPAMPEYALKYVPDSINPFIGYGVPYSTMPATDIHLNPRGTAPTLGAVEPQ